MNREDYIKQCVTQHLANEKCYQRKTENIARQYIRDSMEEFFDFVKQPGLEIYGKDMVYFQQAAETLTCMATFYCLPKTHKNKTPVPLRPVASRLGTPLHALGKWATQAMKPLSTQVSTNIRDSDDFIKKLKALGKIEDNEFFFTSDAVAMCPNINIEEGVASLLLSHETDLLKFGDNFPIKQLIRALRILMKHNVFKFGSTYYLQKDGTEIGQPLATDWAQ